MKNFKLLSVLLLTILLSVSCSKEDLVPSTKATENESAILNAKKNSSELL